MHTVTKLRELSAQIAAGMMIEGIKSKAELIRKSGINRTTAYRHLEDLSIMTVDELIAITKATNQEILIRRKK